MPVPELNTKDDASKCLRCSGALVPGFLSVQQQPFPFEWVMQVPGLNDPEGRNVYGWGADAKRSKEPRRQMEASRCRVTAMRCTSCGMVELRTATGAVLMAD